jgi:predicted DNA repair protein MutK
MPGSSLLALIDDIATVLDDVATLSKVAVKKTAGVLGDDLALNAEQVTGVQVDRELPVVWAVAKGSAINKAILVPGALLISALFPWAIIPLLMLGGAFLCFEGAEKLLHGRSHDDDATPEARLQALAAAAPDLVTLEKEKIKGAIRTDFILSAEIVVIALGEVEGRPLVTQALVLAGIALAMTVGVYGLVAAIVKLDDAGLALSRRPGALVRRVGALLLAAAPRLMKLLSVAGTAAMFLVGGGILVHGIGALEHALVGLEQAAGAVAGVGAVLAFLLPALGRALVGVLAGAAIVGVVSVVGRLRAR